MNSTTAQRSASPSEAPYEALSLPSLSGRAPRTSPIDRLAMRMAVALLLWSSRPSAPSAIDPAMHLLARRELAARREREARWLVHAHRIPFT